MIFDMISDHQINTSYLEQAQLTQVHRWLALYRTGHIVEPRLTSLTAKDFVLSVDGDTLHNGSAGLAEYLNQRNFGLCAFGEPSFPDGGNVSQSVLLACGFSEHSTEVNKSARVSFEFSSATDLMPCLTAIDIKLSDAHESRVDLESQAIASRILCVNHRWHTLVEAPLKDAEPFREIVSDDFAMEFGHGAVHSFEELQSWLYGSASSVKGARHDLESFEWRRHTNSKQYLATFVLDWLGFNQEGQRMMAKTKHDWVIADDDPDARFPRIQHIDVEFLEAFKLLD